jgi:hypothetical protein
MSFVSPRFSRRIEAHLIANFMKSPPQGTPLLLAIHGLPGTGKTYQLDSVLSKNRVFYRTISSSELESENANDPAKLVRRTYIELADEIVRNGYLAGALVINDIDTALGSWGDLVQTTVNRQLVIGELQHISDYPRSVANRPNLRVPIIFTANDLTKLYGPLLRPGRTATFHWEPTRNEIASMLAPLLPNLLAQEIDLLTERVNSLSMSVYVDAIRAATDEKIASVSGDFDTVITRARLGELDEMLAPSLAELFEAFEHLEKERSLKADYSGDSSGNYANVHEDILESGPPSEKHTRSPRRLWMANQLDQLSGRRRARG